MDKQKKIMIVAKQNPLGIQLARALARKIEGKCDYIFDPSTSMRLRKRGTSIKRFDGDFIITLGGDGTFLRASHQTNLPILPVKLEGHGFLCTCTYKELELNINRVLKGNFTVGERTRLKCTKIREGRVDRYLGRILKKEYPLSLNEIAFGRKRPSKILHIELTIDGTLFNFSGDGLMVSTPTGSTAYNSSAGGSLIDPELEAISVIPLYPFYSKIKPMIVPASKKLEVTVHGDCALIVDGHEGDYFKDEATFIIEKGEPVKVIHLSPQRFYERFKNEFL